MSEGPAGWDAGRIGTLGEEMAMREWHDAGLSAECEHEAGDFGMRGRPGF
jgi:hypothetical protein